MSGRVAHVAEIVPERRWAIARGAFTRLLGLEAQRAGVAQPAHRPAGARLRRRADQLNGSCDEFGVVCRNVAVRQHEDVFQAYAHVVSGGGTG